MTLMSLPPSRRDVRQQSIAVLPTPMISTRLADLVDVPEGDRLEPVDADVDVGRVASSRPGMSRSLPFGAPLPTKTASKPLVEQRLHAVDRRVVADVDAHVEDVCRSLRRARSAGRRNDGMLVRIRPPGSSSFSKITTS